MDERQLKNAVRLYAVELLVSRLVGAQCVHDDPENPQDLLMQMRKAASEGAQKPVLSESDPAVSDLFSAELEEAMDRLLRMAEQQIDALGSR